MIAWFLRRLVVVNVLSAVGVSLPAMPTLAEPSGVTKMLAERPVSRMAYAIEKLSDELRGDTESIIWEIKQSGRNYLLWDDIDKKNLVISSFFDGKEDQIGILVNCTLCGLDTKQPGICNLIASYFRERAYSIGPTANVFLHDGFFLPFHIDDNHSVSDAVDDKELAEKTHVIIRISSLVGQTLYRSDLNCDAPLLGSDYHITD